MSGNAEIPPSEMTLDELRVALAPLIPAHAVFDGWSRKAVDSAAGQLGIDPVQARLAFPKNQAGIDPMSGAPSDVPDEQLRELGLQLRPGLENAD